MTAEFLEIANSGGNTNADDGQHASVIGYEGQSVKELDKAVMRGRLLGLFKKARCRKTSIGSFQALDTKFDLYE